MHLTPAGVERAHLLDRIPLEHRVRLRNATPEDLALERAAGRVGVRSSLRRRGTDDADPAPVVGIRMDVFDAAVLLVPLPARPAGATLLGRDLDDAVRRRRAVERRGRRPLDDVDALDLFGIEI